MVNSPKSTRKNSNAEAVADNASTIVQAIQDGNAPTNAQITSTLENAHRTIDSQPQPNTKYGRRAVDDVKDVLSHAQQLLEEKNHDDLFLQLIEHVKLAGEEAKHRAKGHHDAVRDMKADIADMNKAGKRRLRTKSRDVTESLKALAMTLVKNSEFRALLVNFVELFQFMVEESMQRIQQHNPKSVVEPITALKQGHAGQLPSHLTDMANRGQNIAQDASHRAADLGSAKVDQVQQLGNRAYDQTSQLADRTSDKASALGSRVADQTQQLGSRVADQTQQLGSRVTDQAQQLGNDVSSRVDQTNTFGLQQVPDYSQLQPAVGGAVAYNPVYGTVATSVVTATPIASSSYPSADAKAAQFDASYDATKQAAGDIAAHTAQVGSDVKFDVKNTAADIRFDTKATAQDLKYDAKSTATDIKYDAQRTATDLKADAQGVVRDIKQDTTLLARDVSRQATELGREVQQEAREISREVQGAARETVNRATAVGREIAQDFRRGGMPIDPAKRREITDRFFRLWNQITASDEMRVAMESVLDIFGELRAHLQKVSSLAKAQASGGELPKMEATDLVWADVKEIISRWTGRTELETFLNDVNEYMMLIQNDPENAQVFYDLRTYLDDTFEQPSLLKMDTHQDAGALIIDRMLDQLQRWTHHEETEYLLGEARALLDAFSEDETTRNLKEATHRLGRDLVLDSKGRIDFRVTKDVLSAVQHMMVPLFLDQFALVPLPRIETSDDEYDIVVENIRFPGSALLPEQFKLRSEQEMTMAPGTMHHSDAHAKVYLEISQMAAELRDVQFSLAKKKGIKMHDNGTADVKFGGQRANITIEWVIRTRERGINFETTNVQVSLDHLNIHIKEARHDVLLPMITRVFGNTIKHQIEKNVTKVIQEKLNEFNAKLNDIAYDAYRKEAALERQAGHLMDAANSQARMMNKEAHVAVGTAKAAVSGAAHEAHRKFRRAFRPGQGASLKERARSVYVQAQSKYDRAQDKLQSAAQAAQGATDSAMYGQSSSMDTFGSHTLNADAPEFTPSYLVTETTTTYQPVDLLSASPLIGTGLQDPLMPADLGTKPRANSASGQAL